MKREMRLLDIPPERMPACSPGTRSARIVLCDRQTFDFEPVAANRRLVVPLAPAVACAEYASGVLIVRIWDVEIGEGADISVIANHASVSDAEIVPFLMSGPAASVTLTVKSSASTLQIQPLDGSLGAHLNVVLRGSQGDPQGAARATVSVELLLRSSHTSGPRLPSGSVAGSTLRWDEASGRWVESPGVRATEEGHLEVGSADARLIVGNAGGSPRIELNKAPAGVASIALQNDSVDRWALEANTAPELQVKRFDGSGAYVGTAVRVEPEQGTVLTNGLRYTFHAYDRTDGTTMYIGWNRTSAGTSLNSGTNSLYIVAPWPGRLHAVVLRCSGSAGSTTITFHKNLVTSGASNRQVTLSVSANTGAYFDFFDKAGATFDQGDLLAVSINPTSAPNDVVCTCIWRFDETYVPIT